MYSKTKRREDVYQIFVRFTVTDNNTRLMRRIPFFAAALLLALTASAQGRLTTSAHIGSLVESDNYHKYVDKRLGVTESSVKWAYTSRPSFDPEYAVTCRVDDYGAFLTASMPKTNLWYAAYEGNRDDVEIVTNVLRISRDQAWQLEALFRLAVESSSYMPGNLSMYENPDEIESMIEVVTLDGTAYTFISDGRFAGCGSPGPGNCHDLVQIGDMLFAAVNESDISKVEEAILQAEKVKENLFKLVPAGYPNYLKHNTKKLARIYYKDSESTHMHLSMESDGYTLEMGGRSFKGDKQYILSLVSEFKSNCLMIIDDGRMLWNDACDFAAATNCKESGRTTVLTDVSSSKYWNKRNIRNLLTVLPTECTPGAKNLKLKDMTDRLNAAFTSDLEKGGKVTVNPQNRKVLNAGTFNVVEVITSTKETILLYTTSAGCYVDLTLKADGKEYKMTRSEGMEDWDYMSRRNIPTCSEKYAKIFCAHFPALPKGTSEFDVIEDANGRIFVQGLNISGKPIQNTAPEFKTTGYYFNPNGMLNTMDSNTGAYVTSDTNRVVINSITCYKEKTVLTLTQHSAGLMLEPFLLSNATLQLNGGRTLNALKDGNDSPRPRPTGTEYVFELEFEPMTDAETAALNSIVKKVSGEKMPDVRKQAIEAMGKDPEPGPIPSTALCRLTGSDAGSLFAMLNPDNTKKIQIDIYPAK